MKNITITGNHLEVTDALRTFINKKFQKLERHVDRITQSHVTISVQQGQHIAEAKLHIPKHDIVAEQSSPDMYEAIDLLVDKLDRQLLKQKEKMTNHHPHHGKTKRSAQILDEEE